MFDASILLLLSTVAVLPVENMLVGMSSVKWVHCYVRDRAHVGISKHPYALNFKGGEFMKKSKAMIKLGSCALAAGVLSVGALSIGGAPQVLAFSSAEHSVVETAYADSLSWGNLPDGTYEAQWSGNKHFGMTFLNPARVQVEGSTYTITIPLNSAGMQVMNYIKVNGAEVWKQGDSVSSISFTMSSASNTVSINASYSAGGQENKHTVPLTFTISKLISQADNTTPSNPAGSSNPDNTTTPSEQAAEDENPDIEDELRVIPELGIKRLAGETAADTMQAIVQTAFPHTRKTVVLTTNAAYFDALSANALAGALHAPVLLTDINELPAQTRSELQRMQTKTVYICGGSLVVSQAVEDELNQMGIKVKRIFGEMADDTANKIARTLPRISDTCFVTTSWGYADALSASSFAYAKQAPIFLTNYDDGTLSSATLETIRSKGFKRVIIVGGTSVVSPEVEQTLSAWGIANVERVAGETSYDTSLQLAQKLLSMGLRANNMGIATGLDYLDALCGAALCGRYNSVIVLADDTNSSAVETFMAQNRMAIKSYTIFGGNAAVGEDTERTIIDTLQR